MVSSLFLSPVATAFFGVALVDRTARGGHWQLSPLLGNAAVRWVGQVSYGLYVYHVIVYGLLARAANSKGYAWHDLGLIRTPIAVICAFAVTAASFYLMERPLSARFKHRVPYVIRRR
jgi:peptidoglycan/LPS O-acetylase OafA/YrhL